MPTSYHHISVLSDEIIKYLQPRSGKNFVDCTLGGAGHTSRILEETAPDGRVLGFELDPHACQVAKHNLAKYKDRVIIVCRSYVHLKEELENYKKKLKNISGILIDLGLSSHQLDKADRGFSFKDHGPLDMRFNTEKQTLTAADIVLTWPEDKLLNIFREYGDIRQAKSLSRGIIAWRNKFHKQKQTTLKTSVFVSAILRILGIKPNSLQRFRIHPATKVFQSLRLAVNNELDNLKKVLPQSVEILEPGGRLAVISFHSLEDRIVKYYFRKMAKGCICPPEAPICICQNKPSIKIINKRAIRPNAKELARNPRSRSAILRLAEKI